jgi:hypothetical protein
MNPITRACAQAPSPIDTSSATMKSRKISYAPKSLSHVVLAVTYLFFLLFSPCSAKQEDTPKTASLSTRLIVFDQASDKRLWGLPLWAPQKDVARNDHFSLALSNLYSHTLFQFASRLPNEAPLQLSLSLYQEAQYALVACHPISPVKSPQCGTKFKELSLLQQTTYLTLQEQLDLLDDIYLLSLPHFNACETLKKSALECAQSFKSHHVSLKIYPQFGVFLLKSAPLLSNEEKECLPPGLEENNLNSFQYAFAKLRDKELFYSSFHQECYPVLYKLQYQPVYEPKTGDLVLYFSADAKPIHAGLYLKDYRVESKLIDHPQILSHPLFALPNREHIEVVIFRKMPLTPVEDALKNKWSMFIT